MVQLTLPENSRIKPGKTWPKPANAKKTTEFRIYRWNPDDGPIRASTPISSTAMIAARWFSTRSSGLNPRSTRR